MAVPISATTYGSIAIVNVGVCPQAIDEFTLGPRSTATRHGSLEFTLIQLFRPLLTVNPMQSQVPRLSVAAPAFLMMRTQSVKLR